MCKQNWLKLSVVTFILSLHALSFGMFQVARLEKQLPNKKQNQNQVINNDLLVAIAATEDGKVKNGLHKTCKYLNNFITKTNPQFVGLPTFTAHPKDINDTVLFFSWHNKYSEIITSIKEKMISSQLTFPFGKSHALKWWSNGGYECSWPCEFAYDYPGKLNAKYIEQNENAILMCVTGRPDCGKFPSDAEVALVFAALCKDEKAVKIIAAKVKEMYKSYTEIDYNINVDLPREWLSRLIYGNKTTFEWIYEKRRCYSIKMDLHKDLLIRLIEHDNATAFELIVKYDPYEALNLYYQYQDDSGCYKKPFLDYLIKSKYIPQQKKDKYIQIYRKRGGKTLKELEQCIIA